jgi:PEP-CTERM motif
MCHQERACSISIGVILVLLTSAWTSSADSISIPLSAFSGSEQVARFSVTAETPLPYSEAGATFAYTPFGFVNDFLQELNLQRSGTLIVTFNDPILIAGFDFRNHFGTPTMVAELSEDAAGLQSLGQVNFGSFAPFETRFIGLASSSLFTRMDVTWTAPQAASWFIDDFRFDNAAPIPEPGTVSLTLLGIGVLGSRMRGRLRKRRSA